MKCMNLKQQIQEELSKFAQILIGKEEYLVAYQSHRKKNKWNPFYHPVSSYVTLIADKAETIKSIKYLFLKWWLPADNIKYLYHGLGVLDFVCDFKTDNLW